LSLIAGDDVTMSFRALMEVRATDTALATFSESFTVELQYLPEPSASLMLPSGAALLALLAQGRVR